jgi:hypothetical protein
MAQSHQRYCPNCGTPASADERFCTNCGFQINAEQPFSQIPTQYPQVPQAPQSQQQIQQAQRPGQYYQAPPVNQQVPPYAQQPQSKQNPIVEAFAALGLLFLFRRSIRTGYTGRYQRRSSGCCGVITLLVILAIFAAIGYGVYRSVGSSVHNLNSVYSGSGSGGSGSGELTTQPPITTTKINQAVTYSGVNITIVNIQQSKGFLNDPQPQTNGIVRVNIKEQTSDSTGSFLYGDVARIILPDKTSVAPLNAQQSIGPNAGVSRSNWLDFPVPAGDKVDQLTLVLGTTSQTQVTIPLTGKADLSQYQTKSSTPNMKTQYAGLTWTVTSASSSLSLGGRQADKGMLYVTVTLKVDNPTSNEFIAYWGDYFRLKAGDTTSSPDGNSNFPTNFAAGSSGKTGTLYFAMPQGNTSYTLMFLNSPSTQYSPATVNFQVG